MLSKIEDVIRQIVALSTRQFAQDGEEESVTGRRKGALGGKSRMSQKNEGGQKSQSLVNQSRFNQLDLTNVGGRVVKTATHIKESIGKGCGVYIRGKDGGHQGTGLAAIQSKTSPSQVRGVGRGGKSEERGRR